MTQTVITEGNRAVVITVQGRQIFASLYVNAKNGLAHADITTLRWVGKTMEGAKRWASKVMA